MSGRSAAPPEVRPITPRGDFVGHKRAGGGLYQPRRTGRRRGEMMRHERELDRDLARTPEAATLDVSTPGRVSASAALRGPAVPVPSGILMRKRDGNGVADGAEHAVS